MDFCQKYHSKGHYNIQGLEPLTTYEIAVAAVDGNQTVAFSGPGQVETLEGGNLDLFRYLA